MIHKNYDNDTAGELERRFLNSIRSGDPKIKISDPSKIFNEYGWKTKLSFEDLMERCIEKKLSVSF